MLDLVNDDAYKTFVTAPSEVGQTHALVMHTASWCGPCKACKPTYANLAEAWSKSEGGLAAMPLRCATAFEDNVDAAACGISAFPTFVLWDVTTNGGSKVGEIRGGGDLENLKNMVNGHVKRSEMKGESMGGEKLSKDAARAKMLERLGGSGSGSGNSNGNSNGESMDVDTVAATVAATTPPKPPADESKMDTDDFFSQPNNEPSWDPAVIEQLTGAMGFSELRAKKGLMNGNFTTEGAIDWIMAHQDDADIDEPIDFAAKAAAGEVKSYKCNETGKIFKSMADLELYANRTGRSDFSESTEEVKPRTPEEIAAGILEIKNLLAKKKKQREAEEKAHNIAAEKARREMGKEMIKTQEEMKIAERKRIAKQKKWEKDAEKRERERIRAELERDKAERRSNGGKLKSNLGVDGYNPSAIQYEVGAEGGGDGGEAKGDESAPKKQKVDDRKFEQKVVDYIAKVAMYKAGGDGAKCIKVLAAYVGNAAVNPTEEKFKTINMDNKVYKTKVKPFVGAKALLMACGFNPANDGMSMSLDPQVNYDNLKFAKGKLEEAKAQLT